MFTEVQSSDLSFYHLLYLPLWDSSEASKHCQELAACKTLNKGIKLDKETASIMHWNTCYKYAIILPEQACYVL